MELLPLLVASGGMKITTVRQEQLNALQFAILSSYNEWSLQREGEREKEKMKESGKEGEEREGKGKE